MRVVEAWLADSGTVLGDGEFLKLHESAIKDTLIGEKYQLYVDAHEKFAEGFTKYLAEGYAPSAGLRAVFEKFKQWLSGVWENVRGLHDVTLNNDMRDVFDRMLAEQQQIDSYRKGQRDDLISTAYQQGIATATREGGTQYNHLVNALNKYLPEGAKPFDLNEIRWLARSRLDEAGQALKNRYEAKGLGDAKVKAATTPMNELPPHMKDALDTAARHYLEFTDEVYSPTNIAGAEGEKMRSPSGRPDEMQAFIAGDKSIKKYDDLRKVLNNIIEGKDTGVKAERVKRWLVNQIAEGRDFGTPIDPKALEELGVSAGKLEKIAVQAAEAIPEKIVLPTVGDVQDFDVIGTKTGDSYVVVKTDEGVAFVKRNAENIDTEVVFTPDEWAAWAKENNPFIIYRAEVDGTELAQRVKKATDEGQIDMFMAGESSPLISGAAMTAQQDAFIPKETTAATALPGMESSLTPKMMGAKRGGDLSNFFGTKKEDYELTNLNSDSYVAVDKDGKNITARIWREFEEQLKGANNNDVLDAGGDYLVKKTPLAYEITNKRTGEQELSVTAANARVKAFKVDRTNTGQASLFQETPNYGGTHRPPSGENGAPLHDLTGGGNIYPDDVYSKDGRRIYGTADKELDAETFRIVNKTKGKPDADVVIYRAVPKGVQAEINMGDWVTINRKYAESHGEAWLNGNYDIIEKTVKARDIYTNGDSIHEWGYYPGGTDLFQRVGIPIGDGTFKAGDELNYKGGKVRLVEYDSEFGAWLVEDTDGMNRRNVPDVTLEKWNERKKPLLSPPGVMKDYGGEPAPMARADLEAYYGKVRPLLSSLEEAMTQDAARPALNKGLTKGVGVQMDDATRQMLGDYVREQQGKMSESKLAAQRWGEHKRDSSLLNYSRRYQANTMLGMLSPYEFFTTRSMANWALIGMGNPGLVANLYRVNKFVNEQVLRPGFPTRLAGLVKIPMPFLPEWMNEMYINPRKIGLPLENFAAPWEDYAQRQASLENKIDWELKKRLTDKKITQSEYNDALAGRGDLKKKVEDELIAQDPNLRWDQLDYMQAQFPVSLPLKWAYEYLRGTPERIAPMPITRTLKTLSAAAGLGGPEGFNLEGDLRRQMKLPVYDQWTDYRVDRELANMAAEGKSTAGQSNAAMIERSGAVYDQAVQRVMQQQTTGTLAGWVFGSAGQFYPEGEKNQRDLKSLYDAAWVAEKGGDTSALQRFFSAHPEYEARLALYDNKEDRLKNFLIDNVYAGYFALPILYQRQVQAELGKEFTEAFLNKETKSHSSIDPETLASWARTMGRYVPKNVTGKAVDVAFAPPNVARDVQEYYGLRKTLYDWEKVSALQNAYFAIPKDERVTVAPPEVMAYLALPAKSQARRDYIKAHPSVSKYFDSDAPVSVSQRSLFVDKYPQLTQYWDWRRGWLKAHPNAEPYLTEQSPTSPTAQAAKETVVNDPALVRAVDAYIHAQYPLSSGAKTQLQAAYKSQTAGNPSPLTFEKWLVQQRAYGGSLSPKVPVDSRWTPPKPTR